MRSTAKSNGKDGPFQDAAFVHHGNASPAWHLPEWNRANGASRYTTYHNRDPRTARSRVITQMDVNFLIIPNWRSRVIVGLTETSTIPSRAHVKDQGIFVPRLARKDFSEFICYQPCTAWTIVPRAGVKRLHGFSHSGMFLMLINDERTYTESRDFVKADFQRLTITSIVHRGDTLICKE